MTASRTAAPGTTKTPLWLATAPAIFVLLWSGGYAVAKLGLQFADPLTFLALRYVIALAVLVPLWGIVRPPLPASGREWRNLAIVGLLMQGLYFSLSYMAFSHGVSAGVVAIIMGLQPILVGLLAPLVLAERVTLLRWLGLILGLSGATLVILGRSAIEVTSLVGIAAGIAALCSITAATLFEKRFGVSVHPLTSNSIQYAVALAVVLPLAFMLEEMRVEVTWPLMASLGYLVVGNSLIAITLLLAMIRHGEASRISALLFLVPPLAAVIAWLLLDEVMPPLSWAGMAVAGAGVYLATRPTAPSRAA